MTRDEAYQILTEMVKSKNLIKHHLAAEVAMKAIYKRISPKPTAEEEANWGLVGLLHDADYEMCRDHPERHTLILEEQIGYKLDPRLMYAIKAHNYANNGFKPKSYLDWAIYCCDELTGLVVAAALVHPEKKLAPLTVEFVMKRFNSSSFAKGANREQIKMCEKELKIPLEEFVGIVLKAMQEIAESLGL
jgi:predicted hydrolase (HD superfamily)